MYISGGTNEVQRELPLLFHRIHINLTSWSSSYSAQAYLGFIIRDMNELTAFIFPLGVSKGTG